MSSTRIEPYTNLVDNSPIYVSYSSESNTISDLESDNQSLCQNTISILSDFSDIFQDETCNCCCIIL